MLSSQIPLFHSPNCHRFSYNLATMSDILKAMQLLRSAFDRHAGKDGDPTTLTKKEVCDLLKHEGFPVDTSNKAQLDDFFKMLDNDEDGLVNFQEFVTFVAALSVLCCGK